jgi:shikimate kinase
MRAALAAAAKEQKKSNVALIGFMGTGKSKVAQEISRLSGMRMIDVDEEIEKKAGMQISGIFKAGGEASFRKMELEQVKKLKAAKSSVISCGGGVVLDGRNVSALRSNCGLVWLFSSELEIQKRTLNDSSRPLLQAKSRKRKIHQLLLERMPLYASSCDMAVCTNGKKPNEIAEMVLYEVSKTLKN